METIEQIEYGIKLRELQRKLSQAGDYHDFDWPSFLLAADELRILHGKL